MEPQKAACSRSVATERLAAGLSRVFVRCNVNDLIAVTGQSCKGLDLRSWRSRRFQPPSGYFKSREAMHFFPDFMTYVLSALLECPGSVCVMFSFGRVHKLRGVTGQQRPNPGADQRAHASDHGA